MHLINIDIWRVFLSTSEPVKYGTYKRFQGMVSAKDWPIETRDIKGCDDMIRFPLQMRTLLILA